MTTGRILHLQRLSTEDGPGIRTTVFFKGCPLACVWCHNPESISRSAELQWFAVRCIGCGTCVDTCPENCLSMDGEGLRIDREKCINCGKCTKACPTGALETLGKIISSEELLMELEKDRAYYEKSGGGVTLSGGEPTYQADFSEALLRGLKERSIPTALDTCGLTTKDILKRLLPFVNLVLFDIKILDGNLHKQYTSHSNVQILNNLLFISEYIRQTEKTISLWIRTPLIPGSTDSESNLAGIGAFISTELSGVVARWDLCAFNNLCRDQYVRLGLDWQYADTMLMTREQVDRCAGYARKNLFDPAIVHTSDAVRSPEPI